jgi:hypothetical protein
MHQTFALILFLGVVTPAFHAQSRPVTLQELTVPPDRLPNGCSVAAHGPHGPSPWHGSDEPILARIREQFGTRVPVPDGPPASRRELARYYVQLADGIEEGYSAFYQDESPNLIPVVALRFASDQLADAWPPASVRRAVRRLAYGPLVIVVSNGDGACGHLIADYLAGLGK